MSEAVARRRSRRGGARRQQLHVRRMAVPLLRAAGSSSAVVAAAAHAEPRISTTANRAFGTLPQWAWFAALLVLAFGVYPPLARAFLRRRGVRGRWWHRGVWVLAVIHVAAGVLTLEAMVFLSVGYVDVTPLAFVAGWAALVGALTAAYAAVAAARTAARQQPARTSRAGRARSGLQRSGSDE